MNCQDRTTETNKWTHVCELSNLLFSLTAQRLEMLVFLNVPCEGSSSRSPFSFDFRSFVFALLRSFNLVFRMAFVLVSFGFPSMFLPRFFPFFFFFFFCFCFFFFFALIVCALCVCVALFLFPRLVLASVVCMWMCVRVCLVFLCSCFFSCVSHGDRLNIVWASYGVLRCWCVSDVDGVLGRTIMLEMLPLMYLRPPILLQLKSHVIQRFSLDQLTGCSSDYANACKQVLLLVEQILCIILVPCSSISERVAYWIAPSLLFAGCISGHDDCTWYCESCRQAGIWVHSILENTWCAQLAPFRRRECQFEPQHHQGPSLVNERLHGFYSSPLVPRLRAASRWIAWGGQKPWCWGGCCYSVVKCVPESCPLVDPSESMFVLGRGVWAPLGLWKSDGRVCLPSGWNIMSPCYLASTAKHPVMACFIDNAGAQSCLVKG